MKHVDYERFLGASLKLIAVTLRKWMCRTGVRFVTRTDEKLLEK